MEKIKERVIEGFGREWEHFNQHQLGAVERARIFHDYFNIFPWSRLPSSGGIGADIGCGSGRWAAVVAPRVEYLHLVDASASALKVAAAATRTLGNVACLQSDVTRLPFADGTLDFAYSLGVLHHVPDTAGAVIEIAGKLKRGAPLLLYLYYRFDNRPKWYRNLWWASDKIRKVVSRLPFRLRLMISTVIATGAYWPLAKIARIGERRGRNVAGWPLSYYRDKSFYTMRTDSLDRLGTELEQRFTREEVRNMMLRAGMDEIQFSDRPPYWVVAGVKK